MYIVTFERKQYNPATNLWDLWIPVTVVCLGSEIEEKIQLYQIRNLKIDKK